MSDDNHHERSISSSPDTTMDHASPDSFPTEEDNPSSTEQQQQQKRTHPRVYVRASPPAPTFANDNQCEGCKTELGGIFSSNVRHHCRNCGGSFCENCTTPEAIVIPFAEYMRHGKMRACDPCFQKISHFYKQVGSSRLVTWSGLLPVSDSDFAEIFNVASSQVPVAIYSACFFPDHLPHYGHLYLTHTSCYFLAYHQRSKFKIPFSDITSVVKPDLYFLNGLLVYSEEEKFFFAGFNGQRDDCWRRFNSLRTSSSAAPSSSTSSPTMTTAAAAARATSRFKLKIEDQPKALLSSTATTTITAEPDAIVQSMNVLLDTTLETSCDNIKGVFDSLWSNGAGVVFYEKTLMAMQDIDVHVYDWKALSDNEDFVTVRDEKVRVNSGFKVSTEHFSHFRQVVGKHPPKISFPGLPPYASCHRIQRYKLEFPDRFVISELNRMDKIPYSDCFEIETRYVFTAVSPLSVRVQIGLEVHFLKSTWFKGQIQSSTLSESRESMELWASHAKKQLMLSSPSSSSPDSTIKPSKTSITNQPTQNVMPLSSRTTSLALLLVLLLILGLIYVLYAVKSDLQLVLARIDALNDAVVCHVDP